MTKSENSSKFRSKFCKFQTKKTLPASEPDSQKNERKFPRDGGRHQVAPQGKILSYDFVINFYVQK